MTQLETIRRIDIQPFVERLPESELFQGLARAAIAGDNRYNGWWEQLRTEYAEKRLPVDAAVAAYFVAMYAGSHDTGRPGQLGAPEQASRLKQGEKVAARRGGLGNGFISSNSGVLKTDVVALLGHPESRYNPQAFAWVDLGLQFDNRKDMRRVEAGQPFYIGDEEISTAYDELISDGSVNSKESRAYAREGHLDYMVSGAIVSSGIMQRFGLIQGNPKFVEASGALMETALTVVHPEYVHKGNFVENLRLLPFMHALDPVATDKQIEVFAESPFAAHATELAEAVAAIRNTFAIDSMHPAERNREVYTALAEIWGHSFSAEEHRGRLRMPVTSNYAL